MACLICIAHIKCVTSIRIHISCVPIFDCNFYFVLLYCSLLANGRRRPNPSLLPTAFALISTTVVFVYTLSFFAHRLQHTYTRKRQFSSSVQFYLKHDSGHASINIMYSMFLYSHSFHTFIIRCECSAWAYAKLVCIVYGLTRFFGFNFLPFFEDSIVVSNIRAGYRSLCAPYIPTSIHCFINKWHSESR